MEIPNHLSHNPIIKLENYSHIDGKYSDDTDAKGLSIGIATWNESGSTDISAKVWRYDSHNIRWKRNSEELPLHRVIDLANLICEAILFANNPEDPRKLKTNLFFRTDSALLETLKKELKDDIGLKKSLLKLATYFEDPSFIKTLQKF